MDAKKMWQAAEEAARVLGNVRAPFLSIHLGASMAVEEVRALAAEAGVQAHAMIVVRDGVRPFVIESFEAYRHGVRIAGQGNREATAGDVVLHICAPGPDLHPTPAEVLGVLGAT